MSVLVIRTHKRFAVARKVRLGQPKRRGLDGLLIELSLDGCRISHGAETTPFALDQTLTLRIAGAAPIAARVRWLRDGAIGLRFARPLHNAGLEELIHLCRSAASTEAEPVERAYGT